MINMTLPTPRLLTSHDILAGQKYILHELEWLGLTLHSKSNKVHDVACFSLEAADEV